MPVGKKARARDSRARSAPIQVKKARAAAFAMREIRSVEIKAYDNILMQVSDEMQW